MTPDRALQATIERARLAEDGGRACTGSIVGVLKSTDAVHVNVSEPVATDTVARPARPNPPDVPLGKVGATWQHVTSEPDGRVFAELHFDGGGGWSFDVSRRKGVALRGDAPATADGSRYALPMREPHSVEAFPISGGSGAGGAPVIVERGLRTPDLCEYFLSGNRSLVGVLRVFKVGDGWRATFARDNMPAVLDHDAPAPPDGESVLPESLARIVPEEYRYWEDTGKGARWCRDALVSAGIFKASDVKIVGGELCLTVEKRELYDPREHGRPSTPAGVLAAIIPKGRRYVHPFRDGNWVDSAVMNKDDADALLVMSPGDPVVSAEILANAVDGNGIAADWILEHDDTPDARDAFGKVGRPFRIAGDRDRLFCASFPVNHFAVEWIDDTSKAVPVGKPFAGYTDFDACVQAQRDGGKDEASARRICGSLQAELEKILKRDIAIVKADEERFVFGIVLEPNDGNDGAPLDPDTQGDIYSAEEVRNAAHTWMADHQNIGLMHREFINGAAKVLESYLAPVDFVIGGTTVRKGTWLLAIRAVDDGLWDAIKLGKLTGFSIGGSAVRRPVANT